MFVTFCLSNSFLGTTGLSIRYGTRKLQSSPYPDAGASAVYIHPDFDEYEKRNDIAIIKLEDNIRQDARITYGVLEEDTVAPDSPVTFNGWDKTSGKGGRSQIMQKTSLSVISPKDCLRLLAISNGLHNHNLICVRPGNSGSKACKVSVACLKTCLYRFVYICLRGILVESW